SPRSRATPATARSRSGSGPSPRSSATATPSTPADHFPGISPAGVSIRARLVRRTGENGKPRESPMRFMILGKGSAETEAGVMPSQKLVDDMMAYNESLARAGVLLAAEGLHPSSRAARIVYGGGKPPRVVDGPFAETKEIIAGFWLIEVKSREEAI